MRIKFYFQVTTLSKTNVVKKTSLSLGINIWGKLGAEFNRNILLKLTLNVKLLKVLLKHIKYLEYLSEEVLIHLTKTKRRFHN